MKPSASLRTWPAERLARLLRARPDLADPPPRDLAELARRADSPRSLHDAVHDLPTPSRLVLEGLALLDHPTVELLVQLSRPAPSPAQVDEAVADLRDRLLLGPSSLVVPPQVADALPAPARLGHGLGELLGPMSAGAVHAVAAGFGLPPQRSKALAVSGIVALFEHPTAPAQLLAALPEGVRERLRALDEEGPVVHVPGLDPARGRFPDDDDLGTCVDLGLAVMLGGSLVELPREVALALRAPHPLRLVLPPEPTGAVPADPTAVTAGAVAAAYGAVEGLDRLADALDREPLPLLASGGVSVRELRRVADDLGRPLPDVTLLLELLDALGLVRRMSKDVRLTRTWDSWRRAPEPERWERLAQGWTRLTSAPAARTGRSSPALKGYGDLELGEVRSRLLAVLRSAPPDSAPGDVWAARYAARWFEEPQRTYGPPRRRVQGDLLAGLLAEAELLGLMALGAPSPLCAGRAAALTSLDGVGEERVRAQADGTLVCTGTPSRRMRTDLDRLATVESRSAASVWRVSEASLSAAYADGLTAEQALAALQRWAGELPQAMAYLVQDAERRAGRLRTGAAASYLVADDPGALGDALSALKGVPLTRVAPTVAISTAAPHALAAALRTAGLAATAAGGAPARPIGKRGAPVVVPAERRPPQDDELAGLAARLVGG